jgi:chromosome partitioning protein
VLAQPFIVMRNDHQDALSGGQAVTEFAPTSKSADEIRALWRWVEARLAIEPKSDAALAEQPIVGQLPAAPSVVPTMFALSSSETANLG